MAHVDDLVRQGAMWWRDEQSWVANPEEVVRALTEEGFQEYKRETARDGHAHVMSGGMWQGLDPSTGAVATVIWVSGPTPEAAHLHIVVDGHLLEGRPLASRFDGGVALSMS